VIVDCGIYDGGVRRAGTFTFEEAYEASKRPDTFVWLGLYEPTPDEFASVKTAFELHELAVEDALKAHQRPKLEVYDDTLFIVVKTARYVDSDEVVSLG
jgi:magnesium transporter